MTHPDWTALNDYADGALPPGAREGLAHHLDECAECRVTLERLRTVLRMSTSAAAATADAPTDAWDGVRVEIERRKVVPIASEPGVRARRPVFRLAAAAVFLVVASSAVTVLVVNRTNTPAVTVSAQPPDGASGVRLVALPPELAATERGYLTTVDELTATLQESHALLAPETVQAVERSLRVIDAAIAEAREALLNDPSSLMVRDLLRRGYEQKVDLLRRTTARLLET